jgi:CAAX prenyl protease-like protein
LDSRPQIEQKTAVVTPAAARVIPFATYIAFLILETTLAGDAYGFDSRWLYAVKIACVAIALGILWNRYSELRERPPGATQLLASVVIGIVVFVVWIALDQSWAVIGSPRGWNPTDASGTVNWSLVAVRILGAAAVVPIMEELFWRSLVLRWIRNADFLNVAPAHAGALAVLVSSALFASEHHQWLAGLIAGVAYAGTYMRTGNLWCAVVAHAVTNLALGLWVLHSGQWQYW